MTKKPTLFGASFEQSKRIVSKSILTEDGAQIGLMSSMRLRTRLSLPFFALFGLGLLYMIGVGLPQPITSEDSGLLAQSTWQLIHQVGYLTIPVTKILIVLHFICIVLNVFPKPNYAYQLIYGNALVLLFVVEAQFVLLPFSMGLTVGAFGWLGFVLQLLACLYLFHKLILKELEAIKQQLYKTAIARKDWGALLMTCLKKYGGLLLALSILNRWTFNFGELASSRPDIFSFLYGWMFIFSTGLQLFGLNMMLKSMLASFYFFKYRKEYRQHFKITDEQWYGKWRAKLKKMMT